MFSLRSPVVTERNPLPLERLNVEFHCPRKGLKRFSKTRVSFPARELRLNLVSMAITGIECQTSAVILTSGASGRASDLLSLRTFRRLVFSIHALLLWLFMSFQQPSKWLMFSQKTEKRKIEVSYLNSVMKILFPRRRKFRRDEDEDVCRRRSLAMKNRVLEGSSWQYYLFVTLAGRILFTQSWTPVFGNSKAIVVLLHGLNEHSGRYTRFSRQLNSHGYKVYGMDWIGHGGSDGLHGYVPSLDQAIADAKAFLEKVKSENPSFPCFLFGHSTGGAIILKAALDPDVEKMVKGVVITSPALRVRPAHPVFGVIAPIFSFLLPRYQFAAANKKGGAVSRDPLALLAKYSDPLVYTGPIRVRTGSEILRICSYLQQNMKRITVPFLVLHGTTDTVTDPDASQELYNQAASKHKTIKLYEGLLHDLLFEPEGDKIASDIIAWLDSKLES